ncbi:MAG: DUF4340 domain-containing protein [Kiritimatiellia bacterium]
MKPGKLFTLVIVAAVLVALALWTQHRQLAAPPSDIGRKLLPALALESIARVEISRSGPSITLVRGDAGWTVTNLFGYPADLSKLQTALLALADLKIGEVARGVNIDTNATLLDLQDAAGKPLATLRLGAAPDMSMGGGNRFPPRPPQGRHVAVAGNPQVYLVKEGLEAFDGEPRTWANSQLLALQSADIQTLELAGPTGATVCLSRDSGSLQMQGISTNEEFDASKAYDVESAFSYLNFTGVADPKLDAAQTGLSAPRTYRIKLKNGDCYTARIGAAAASGDRYLRLEATLAAPGTNATAVTEHAARKAELEQKFANWTYLVASSTATHMTYTREDLIKPKTIDTNSTTSAEAPVAP